MFRVYIENEQGFKNNFVSSLPITKEDYMYLQNRGWKVLEIKPIPKETIK